MSTPSIISQGWADLAPPPPQTSEPVSGILPQSGFIWTAPPDHSQISIYSAPSSSATLPPILARSALASGQPAPAASSSPTAPTLLARIPLPTKSSTLAAIEDGPAGLVLLAFENPAQILVYKLPGNICLRNIALPPSRIPTALTVLPKPSGASSHAALNGFFLPVAVGFTDGSTAILDLYFTPPFLSTAQASIELLNSNSPASTATDIRVASSSSKHALIPLEYTPTSSSPVVGLNYLPDINALAVGAESGSWTLIAMDSLKTVHGPTGPSTVPASSFLLMNAPGGRHYLWVANSLYKISNSTNISLETQVPVQETLLTILQGPSSTAVLVWSNTQAGLFSLPSYLNKGDNWYMPLDLPPESGGGAALAVKGPALLALLSQDGRSLWTGSIVPPDLTASLTLVSAPLDVSQLDEALAAGSASSITHLVADIPNPKPVLDWVWKSYKSIQASLDPLLKQLLTPANTSAAPQNAATTLDDAAVSISILSAVMDSLSTRQTTPEGASALEAKASQITATSTHLRLVRWLIGVGVAPVTPITYPTPVFVESYALRRSERRAAFIKADYVDPSTGESVIPSESSTDVLFVDALVAALPPSAIKALGGSYPAPSLASLLAPLRLPSVDPTRVFALVFYYLMDLDHSEAWAEQHSGSSTLVEQFSKTFGLPAPLQAVLFGWWLLDAASYLDEAARQLADPAAASGASEWGGKVLQTFLDFGAIDKGMAFMRIVRPAWSSLQEAVVGVRLLLAGGAFAEAWELIQTYGAGDSVARKHLLTYYWRSAWEEGRLASVFSSPMDAVEEEGLLEWLRARKGGTGLEFAVPFLLMRGRVSAALSIHQELKASGHDASIEPTAAGYRQDLLDNFLATVPPIVRPSVPDDMEMSDSMDETATNSVSNAVDKGEELPDAVPAALPLPAATPSRVIRSTVAASPFLVSPAVGRFAHAMDESDPEGDPINDENLEEAPGTGNELAEDLEEEPISRVLFPQPEPVWSTTSPKPAIGNQAVPASPGPLKSAPPPPAESVRSAKKAPATPVVAATVATPTRPAAVPAQDPVVNISPSEAVKKRRAGARGSISAVAGKKGASTPKVTLALSPAPPSRRNVPTTRQTKPKPVVAKPSTPKPSTAKPATASPIRKSSNRTASATATATAAVKSSAKKTGGMTLRRSARLARTAPAKRPAKN